MKNISKALIIASFLCFAPAFIGCDGGSTEATKPETMAPRPTSESAGDGGSTGPEIVSE